MYSKTLKFLLQSGANLKFKIEKRKESIELQEFLFALGAEWFIEPYIIRNCRRNLIVTSKYDRYIITSIGCTLEDDIIFERLPHKEFDVKKDRLVGEK